MRKVIQCYVGWLLPCDGFINYSVTGGNTELNSIVVLRYVSVICSYIMFSYAGAFLLAN